MGRFESRSVIDGLHESDLAALADMANQDRDELGDMLRRRPWLLHELLSDPSVAAAVLDDDGPRSTEEIVVTSPTLFFAVLVHRAAADLVDSQWVAEWTGPRARLPVFDVEPLVAFVQRPARLLYLAQLLVSFTAPSPLPVPVPIHSLDLDGLVMWLDAVEPVDRPAVLRRLGDVSLFLAGVCADNTGRQTLTPASAERLGSSVGLEGPQVLDLIDPGSMSPGLDALETLGSRWYTAAATLPDCRLPAVSIDLARHINPARRFLNHLADRYLHHVEPLPPGFAA